MAGGPLIIALVLSRFGNLFYLNNYTTNSANMMIRELGISLFLASVGLEQRRQPLGGFCRRQWLDLDCHGRSDHPAAPAADWFDRPKVFPETYFEICGLLAGASTGSACLAFATRFTGSDILGDLCDGHPLTMILRIVAQLLIFAGLIS